MDAFLRKGKLGREAQEDEDDIEMIEDEDGDSTKERRGGRKSAQKKTEEHDEDQRPWVEKYRPRTVDDVVAQEEIVAVLNKCLQGGGFPNLLFYGPPGTGKTSTILALARQMFGTHIRQRVLELNASDERGISVIREKVKGFAAQAVSQISGDTKCPNIKLVILDEADSMTAPAQASLRRIMETQNKTTRFCLICNYVTRIIDPIASRCSKFRFKPVREDLLIQRLEYICEQENVKLDKDNPKEVLKELVFLCEGDLRRAITILQTVYRFKGISGEHITIDDIQEVAGFVPNKTIESFIDVCRSKDHRKLIEFCTDFIADGHSTSQLLLQIHEWFMNEQRSSKVKLNDEKRAKIGWEIAKLENRLLDRSSEYLQLLQLGNILIEAFKS